MGVVAAHSCSAPDDPVRGVIRHLYLDDPVREAAAPVACSALDVPVRGVCPHLSPDDPVRGGGSSACLFRPGSSSSLLPCFTLASFPWLLLRLTTASLRCASWWVPLAGKGCCLTPPPVPSLCVCGACCPGLRHPAAFFAWHLVMCRGCGGQHASLVCLLALQWCATPLLVLSISVHRLAFLSLWCLPPPLGLSPPDSPPCCAGHVEANLDAGLMVPAAGSR